MMLDEILGPVVQPKKMYVDTKINKSKTLILFNTNRLVLYSAQNKLYLVRKLRQTWQFKKNLMILFIISKFFFFNVKQLVENNVIHITFTLKQQQNII